jgi:diaminopimelate decarboxylase
VTLFEILPSLRRAAIPRVDRAIWPLTTHIDELGRLCVGGLPVTDVADQFRTPTYVIDEADFHYRIHRYRRALPNARILYPGKALLTTAVARWVTDEQLGLDISSDGELASALAGGVNPKRIVMHGNGRTPDELRRAAAVGVGRIILDSPVEASFLAGGVRRAQSVLVRVTPDIDVDEHTVERILDQPLLYLVGLRCHIGSQITDAMRYGEVIRKLIGVMADLRAGHGIVLTELIVGGEHAVPYVTGDPELDLGALAEAIDGALEQACAAARFPRPAIMIEPGRAISARAGVTLYRVLSVKSQSGERTVVSVDGGMSDNPRLAPYNGRHSVVLANRHPLAPTRPMTVVGRHCESSDEIARDVPLPIDIHPGDLLAVACTGAYHHSMSSTYNMVGRPPLVAVKDGRTRELVRRETIADLLSRDRGWAEPSGSTAHPSLDSGYEALLHPG